MEDNLFVPRFTPHGRAGNAGLRGGERGGRRRPAGASASMGMDGPAKDPIDSTNSGSTAGKAVQRSTEYLPPADEDYFAITQLVAEHKSQLNFSSNIVKKATHQGKHARANINQYLGEPNDVIDMLLSHRYSPDDRQQLPDNSNSARATQEYALTETDNAIALKNGFQDIHYEVYPEDHRVRALTIESRTGDFGRAKGKPAAVLLMQRVTFDFDQRHILLKQTAEGTSANHQPLIRPPMRYLPKSTHLNFDILAFLNHHSGGNLLKQLQAEFPRYNFGSNPDPNKISGKYESDQVTHTVNIGLDPTNPQMPLTLDMQIVESDAAVNPHSYDAQANLRSGHWTIRHSATFSR